MTVNEVDAIAEANLRDEEHCASFERPFENVEEVNIKKSGTKGTNCSQFTNSILHDTLGDVPSHYQIRLVIHSNQWEYPIAFPHMAPQQLTSEWILSENALLVASLCMLRVISVLFCLKRKQTEPEKNDVSTFMDMECEQDGDVPIE